MNKKRYEAYLNEVSEVVMAANDKKEALISLKNNMSNRYKPALLTLESIINNDYDILKTGKHGLWQVLFDLSHQSKQPISNFIKEYKKLFSTRTNLKDSFKVNIIGYGYIIMLTIYLIIYYIFFKTKIAPEFKSFFDGLSANTPHFTSYATSTSFLIFSLFIFLAIAFFGFFVPWHYRKALTKMRPLPFYLRIIPMYYSCTKKYHKYL